MTMIWVDVVYMVFLSALISRLAYLIHFDLPNGGWEVRALWSGYVLYMAYRITYTM